MEDTKTKLGDAPAFASVAYSVSGDGYCQEGLTIREYFAAKAMQGLLTITSLSDHDCEVIAKHAVNQADALIRALANEA